MFGHPFMKCTRLVFVGQIERCNNQDVEKAVKWPLLIHSTRSSALFWNTRLTSSGRIDTSFVWISTKPLAVAWVEGKKKKQSRRETFGAEGSMEGRQEGMNKLRSFWARWWSSIRDEWRIVWQSWTECLSKNICAVKLCNSQLKTSAKIDIFYILSNS